MRAGVIFATLSLGVAAVTVGAACSGSATTAGRGNPMGNQDDNFEADESLARDLEATVLESFAQHAVGERAAYTDSLARDRDVTLVGIWPDGTATGVIASGDEPDSVLFPGMAEALRSKSLEIHLSADSSIGWVFDEVSVRVPYRGRTASIPIRITSVWEHDIDRWVLVQEHRSYALPLDEIGAMARAGTLTQPSAIGLRFEKSGLAKLLHRVLLNALNERDPERFARYVTSLPDSVFVFPNPGNEARGAQIAAGGSLAELFGPDGAVSIVNYRIGSSRSGKTAWISTVLEATTRISDDDVKIRLRGTFVFENRGRFGWEVVSGHVSAPVTRAELGRRVFGEVDLQGTSGARGD